MHEDTRALFNASLIGLAFAVVAVLVILLAATFATPNHTPAGHVCTVYGIANLQDPQIVPDGAAGWYFMHRGQPAQTYVCRNGTLVKETSR